ncbi:MAG: leucyl aminopeptidase family protein [Chitinivibrionales bacterium]|nr:leucyl aminopeptidase family protein [Chitinivibrionales bacterium]
MKTSIATTARYDTHLILTWKEDATTMRDFEGKKSEISVRYDGRTTLIYCGCGEKKECTLDAVREATAAGSRKAGELKRKAVSVFCIDPTPQPSISLPDCVKASVEGALLGTYQFNRYKSEKLQTTEHIEFITNHFTAKQLHETQSIIECVFFARDLVNENAEIITPQRFAKEAQSLAKQLMTIKCTILNEKEIETQKLGLLKAVGQGSVYPPRLIILEYKGNPKTKESVALVGKGITFDCGGYNLKPSGHIETMSNDMAGAAAVLATVKAVALLKLRINVIAVIAAAHNALDAASYFPGDIHVSYAGKSVEILNTDAEGRLILADAIAYCQDVYNPSELIDLATLTGSIISSFGDYYAGMFASDDGLADRLIAASAESGEKLWRMPLSDYFLDSMKGDRADLRNLSKLPRGHAGAVCGAAFLQHFIDGIPWAHLDIAGVAYNERECRGDIAKYGTGFGVRLLVAYLNTKIHS